MSFGKNTLSDIKRKVKNNASANLYSIMFISDFVMSFYCSAYVCPVVTNMTNGILLMTGGVDVRMSVLVSNHCKNKTTFFKSVNYILFCGGTGPFMRLKETTQPFLFLTDVFSRTKSNLLFWGRR